MKYYPMIPALLVFAACSGTVNNPDISATGGRIDLSQVDLTGQSTDLTGEWKFYYHQLFMPEQTPPESGFIEVPGAWSTGLVNGKELDAFGYATYQLEVELPQDRPLLGLYSNIQGTAWNVYAGSEYIGGSGNVAKTGAGHRAAFDLDVLLIPEAAIRENKLTLTVQISNFTDRNAGMWNPFRIGSYESLKQFRMVRTFFDLFAFASILGIGLYHLALFLSRRSDTAALSFAVVCLLLAFRAATTGDHILEYIMPQIPFEFWRKLEYTSFYLALPSFLTFLCLAMDEKHTKKIAYIFWPVPVLLTLLILATPLAVYSQTLTWYIIFLSVGMMSAIWIWIRAIRAKRPAAAWSLTGGIVFAITVINDILHTFEIELTGIITLAPFGLLAFILAQSYLIARIFAKAYRQAQDLSATLLDTNKSFSRFVPSDFLTYLNRSDIREVRLGDQVLEDMAVMFCDIRAFTSISEKLSPEENFKFLNNYLGRVVPLIDRYSGFVDKYIGDAIMALFPGPRDDSVQAAIAIQEEIRNYNRELSRQNKDLLKVGIGIHSGQLIMGTIGSQDRLESTVISDAVNTAARIEELTKLYSSPIVISEDVKAGLQKSYHIRLLDRVIVKGKSREIQVYEVLNGQPDYVLDLFEQTRDSFETGVFAAWEGNWKECVFQMQSVLSINPADEAARMFIKRADQRV